MTTAVIAMEDHVDGGKGEMQQNTIDCLRE